MYTLMEALAKMAYMFGVEGAWLPSYMGNYETIVPEVLTDVSEDHT